MHEAVDDIDFVRDGEGRTIVRCGVWVLLWVLQEMRMGFE